MELLRILTEIFATSVPVVWRTVKDLQPTMRLCQDQPQPTSLLMIMTDSSRRRAPALPLLGGLSAATFLREYWQKKPLLVRQAIPDFAGYIGVGALRKLIGDESVQSRLVIKDQRTWSLEHGPFSAKRWKALTPARPWTVLVQELNFHVAEADALLDRFNFIPHARVDDVMVSHACPGGGVGAHVDSYDVFLLQGPGRRRWRISAQQDLALRPDLPLRILKHFKPEQEWILEPGDMLYLPPRYAHEGTAIDECFTYSIGFRAPSAQEWVSLYLMDYAERLTLSGAYTDPDLRLGAHPGALPASMPRFLAQQVKALRFPAASMRDFSGRLLTEPKPHVFFPPADAALGLAAFRKQALARGIRLDPRTRLLADSAELWCNGEQFAVASVESAALITLADQRELSATALAVGDAVHGKAWRSTLWPMLLQWYDDGWLRLAAT